MSCLRGLQKESVASSRSINQKSLFGVQSASIDRPIIHPDFNVCLDKQKVPEIHSSKIIKGNSSLTVNWTASDTIVTAIKELFFGGHLHMCERSFSAFTTIMTK